jgi:hypothetical protein
MTVGQLEFIKMEYDLYELDGDGEKMHVRSPSGSTTYFNPSIDIMEFHRRFGVEHGCLVTAERLRASYPYLYFSVRVDRDGVGFTTWVCMVVDGKPRDGTATGYDGTLPGKTDELERLNQEAKKSQQDGWFFCTGHGVAERQGKGGYHYFAGRYCAQYGEEHPDHKKAALAETYE